MYNSNFFLFFIIMACLMGLSLCFLKRKKRHGVGWVDGQEGFKRHWGRGDSAQIM